ncbi:MAG TPA: 30S ribosomal protein S9 [Chlamydiales bacterium]|nr:30S ribosomal protein S9 [Chlamydiales bacterium]
MVKNIQKDIIGVGRRKTAVASVRLRKGKGKVLVNQKPFEEYFSADLQRSDILSPLKKTELSGEFDLIFRINGGGIQAQSEAARLAVARAIVANNEQFRQVLKENGYLTRDPRMKERKKYGLAGARKSFQFSKR